MFSKVVFVFGFYCNMFVLGFCLCFLRFSKGFYCKMFFFAKVSKVTP